MMAAQGGKQNPMAAMMGKMGCGSAPAEPKETPEKEKPLTWKARDWALGSCCYW